MADEMCLNSNKNSLALQQSRYQCSRPSQCTPQYDGAQAPTTASQPRNIAQLVIIIYTALHLAVSPQRGGLLPALRPSPSCL